MDLDAIRAEQVRQRAFIRAAETQGSKILALMDAAAAERPVPAPEPEPEPVVEPTPEPEPVGFAPRPPVLHVEVEHPGATGTIHTVGPGDDLQAALDRAVGGDVVEISPEQPFTRGVSSFLLRPRADEGTVFVRTSRYADLPAARAYPEAALPLARLVGAQSNARVLTALPGARGWHFDGVEIAPDTTGVATQTNALVELMAGSSHLTFDRSIIAPQDHVHLARAVILNSAHTALRRSYLVGHGKGMDTQAVVGWEGTGPVLLEDDYLAGAGENVMFGGARMSDAAGAGVPRNITIRRCWLHKPEAWRGVWTVKNLFELKIAELVEMEACILEGCWADAQVGYAVNIKSENHNKDTEPDNATRDFLMRNCLVTKTRYGATVIGTASTLVKTGTGRTERIAFDNVAWELDGDIAFQVAAVKGLAITRNTANGQTTFDGAETSTGLTMRGNLLGGWIKGGGTTIGQASLDRYAPGAVVTGNAIAGEATRKDLYPAGNEFPATMAEYTGPAGADRAAIEDATRGVRHITL